MPDIEANPTEYKNKHSKRINLGSYRGVGNDLMELNEPVADGFMRVSDMRGDIVVIQKPQDRVRDYDDIGFVRVAKFLKMPKMDFWRGDHITQTRKENDTWYIAVNDQDLADKVVRDQTSDKKFDERFLEAFRGEINSGLGTILQREKLLNGGKYSRAFLIGYYSLLCYDLALFPAIGAAIALGGADNSVEATAIFSAAAAGIHAGHNGLHLLDAASTWIHDRIGGYRPEFSFYPRTRYDDPFVRHSIPELVMPAVPVDRLARGLYYLNKHGEKMITKSEPVHAK